jgi:hypothetical protein
MVGISLKMPASLRSDFEFGGEALLVNLTPGHRSSRAANLRITSGLSYFICKQVFMPEQSQPTRLDKNLSVVFAALAAELDSCVGAELRNPIRAVLRFIRGVALFHPETYPAVRRQIEFAPRQMERAEID